MKSIAYHADLAHVQDEAGLYALLDSPARSTPFERLAWWRALAGECGLSPVLAVCRDDETGQTAVLPLARGPTPRHLHALANWYSFRVGPVCSTPGEALPLLTALARNLPLRARRVTMSPVSNESGQNGMGDASLLAHAFRDAGWFVDMQQSDTNHILPVAGRSYAEYFATRPGPLRTTLKRKQNKVQIELFQHFDEQAWAAYEEVYTHSWKPSEASPAFLKRFAKEEAEAGRLRLGIAREVAGTGARELPANGGRPVAAQLWTVEGGTAFIHKLAHTEDSRALSPGTTLSAALFEQVIDRDHVALVDFGTGDDPYKRDWMEQQRPRYRLDMIRPGALALWPQIARAWAKRLARALHHG